MEEELANREARFDEGRCCFLYADRESRTTTDIKRVYSDGSLVTLHTFDSPRDFPAKIGPFAPISNRDFVFWGEENVGWLGLSLTGPPSPSHPPPCKKPRTEDVADLARVEADSKPHVWRTNELQRCNDNPMPICPNCGLIAVPHVSLQGCGKCYGEEIDSRKADR